MILMIREYCNNLIDTILDDYTTMMKIFNIVARLSDKKNGTAGKKLNKWLINSPVHPQIFQSEVETKIGGFRN